MASVVRTFGRFDCAGWFDETAAHTRLSRIAWWCMRSSIRPVSTGGIPTARTYLQVCRAAKCDAAKKSYELTGEYYLANAEVRSFFVFDQG